MPAKPVKVLITGGAGFIGSHQVEACLAAGYEVAVLDSLTTGKAANLQGLNVQLFQVDLLDREKLEKVFQDWQPTHVSHHAAQVSVRRSLEDPRFDAEVNVLGTINLLQLAKRFGVQQFVFASTGGAIYGENESHVPANEETLAKPTSPYAIAKLASEFYVNYYATQVGFKATILRYGNVYGPRQDPAGEAGVVCLFLDKFKANTPATIYGSGEQVRDFIFVKDVAMAHLAAIEKAADGVFNIGSGAVTSVNSMHEALAKVWQTQTGQTIAPVIKKEPIKGEIVWSALDVTKARDVIDWQVGTDLEQGLVETISWFRAA